LKERKFKENCFSLFAQREMKVYLHFEGSGLPEYTLILTLANDAPDTFSDLLDVRGSLDHLTTLISIRSDLYHLIDVLCRNSWWRTTSGTHRQGTHYLPHSQ
jgi:hypothetical protein